MVNSNSDKRNSSRKSSGHRSKQDSLKATDSPDSVKCSCPGACKRTSVATSTGLPPAPADRSKGQDGGKRKTSQDQSSIVTTDGFQVSEMVDGNSPYYSCSLLSSENDTSTLRRRLNFLQTKGDNAPSYWKHWKHSLHSRHAERQLKNKDRAHLAGGHTVDGVDAEVPFIPVTKEVVKRKKLDSCVRYSKGSKCSYPYVGRFMLCPFLQAPNSG